MNDINYKICKKCQNSMRLIDNYRQCKYLNGNYYFKAVCKKCESKARVQYVKTYGLKLTSEQKERYLKYKKEWRKNNKENINKQYRDKYSSNLDFRIRKNVSRAIHHTITKFGSRKNSSIMKYLKYTINELRLHLESQFDDKMSWSNYGIYWHIDHIIPQSCLPYTSMNDENFKKCWGLNNLRPLEAKLNMLDGSTRIRHKMYNNFLTEQSNG